MHSASDLLAGFDRSALDESASSIAAIGTDGVIRWVNRAWRRRAGGYALDAEPVGTSYLAAIGGDLRAFFEGALAKALQTRSVLELDYACPTPEEQRSFRLRALPLDAGLLLEHALVAQVPAKIGEEALENRYRNAEGVLVQCGNCRRVKHPASSAWHWVPAWVKALPSRVSHGLCESCMGFFWGRKARP